MSQDLVLVVYTSLSAIDRITILFRMASSELYFNFMCYLNIMKKGVLICLLFGFGVMLSGCSLEEARQWIEGKTTTVVKQDQQNEQGYVLTREDVYAAYDT